MRLMGPWQSGQCEALAPTFHEKRRAVCTGRVRHGAHFGRVSGARSLTFSGARVLSERGARTGAVLVAPGKCV